MKKINIPRSNSNEIESIEIEKNMVIVGANGSGKSRFGSKIEHQNKDVKRISAQRYLQLNEVVQKKDYTTSAQELNNAYHRQPSIQPQSDYQQVLITLFAEESSRDAQYVASARASENKPEVPDSVKEVVVKIWDFIFPYRPLKLQNDRVRASDAKSEFSGTEMSEGEKVGLYLISQILLAVPNSLLIIDEPELHLHKALMVRLWNKLEEYRNDCTFIYITHDLDFAVSKPTSKLIWVQSYKDGCWDWKELSPNEIIPENLFLEVLGSRKPILFVEGEKGSLDIQIYQATYEDFTVIPCGSWEKVIEAVKGLSAHPDLHGKKVYGLIDRDFHTDERLEELKKDNVFSIVLNKVENLFLVPEIIKMVCEYLMQPRKKEEVIQKIRESYEENKEKIEFKALKTKRQRHLSEKIGSVKDNNGYENFKVTILSELDSLRITNFPDRDSDLITILKFYPYKGLVKQVQDIINLKKEGYQNLVLGLLNSDKKQELIDILKPYLPELKLK